MASNLLLLQWSAAFREDSTVSFEAIYHGRSLGRYIAPDVSCFPLSHSSGQLMLPPPYEGKYLTLSKSALYFSIQESHQEVYS